MDNRTLATGRVVVLDLALLLTQPGPSLLGGRDYINVRERRNFGTAPPVDRRQRMSAFGQKRKGS